MPKRNSNRDQDGLYRRMDSPYWWASFIDGRGKPARRSTGTTDKAEAKALRARWELESYRERQAGPRPGITGHTFHELMMLYMQASEKRSRERDNCSLKRLYPQFATRKVASLTAADVRGDIIHRQAAGVGIGTINCEIGLMSAAINWARSELDWEVNNPVAGRKLREPEGRIRWITRAEAAVLLQAATGIPKVPHLVNFIQLALNTVLRHTDIRVTMRYAHLAPENVRAAVEALEGNVSRSVSRCLIRREEG